MSDSVAPESIVTIEAMPQAVVVHLLERELVAQSNLDVVCAAIDKAQASAPAKPFILDLAKVAFMGSLAMGVLAGVSNEFKKRGQRLMLAGLQRNVLQSLNVSRMNQLMEIVPDVAAGIATVK
jgi:anti-anti-sigma factor